MALKKQQKNYSENQSQRENTESAQFFHRPDGTQTVIRSKQPETITLALIIAFILVNIGLITLISRTPVPTHQFQQLLGNAPPVTYIKYATALFIMTEVILTLFRSSKNLSARHACKQFFFFSLFALLFWTAGSLEQNYMPLFIAGTALLTGEYFRLLKISLLQKANRINVQR